MVFIKKAVDRSDRSTSSWGRTLMMFWSLVCGMFLMQMKDLFFLKSAKDNVVSTPTVYAQGLRKSAYGDQCRYYLAESAIPMGGLGIFTAVGVPPNEVLSIPDICIYVADSPHGIQLRSHSYGRGTFFGQWEGQHSRAACEGLATLMNTMPVSAINTKIESPKGPTNAGLDRRRNPGAGAITHHYGISSISLDNIPAGSELTHDYGDWEFDKDPEEYMKPHRPPEWLAQHGFCIDNIDIGPATNPEMGRGAFATRALEKGTVVAPAPLQVYPERSRFFKKGVEELIVNYCFQAPDSEMLFYPYGPAVNLINHSSRKPNVGLRWSKSSLSHNAWLDLSLDQFWEMSYPGGLILEVYALRDIKPGEELYLDYGKDWEETWNKHVAQWEPPEDAEDYVYPADMDETAPLRTMEEQKTNPYAPNLALVCNTPDWRRKKSNVITWSEPQHTWGADHNAFCHVLKREKAEHGDYVYTVSVNIDDYHADDYDFDPSVAEEDRYIDIKVPRRAIRFVDKPYHDDDHMKTAFRHPIGLPKELFPQQWM